MSVLLICLKDVPHIYFSYYRHVSRVCDPLQAEETIAIQPTCYIGYRTSWRGSWVHEARMSATWTSGCRRRLLEKPYSYGSSICRYTHVHQSLQLERTCRIYSDVRKMSSSLLKDAKARARAGPRPLLETCRDGASLTETPRFPHNHPHGAELPGSPWL